MHRNAIRSAGSSGLRRTARSSVTSKRLITTQSRQASSRDEQDEAKLDRMKKLTNAVITRAAAGEASPGWRVSEANRLKLAKDPAAQLRAYRKEAMSDEKATFSQPSEDDADAGMMAFGEQVAAGSFVEVRRNTRATTGVVINTRLQDSIWLTTTLTTNGDLWEHLPTDVMYVVPNFVSADLAHRCQGDMETTERHSACIEVLRHMRDFERTAEKVYNGLSRHIPGLYEQIRHKDPRHWSKVSLAQAARLIPYDVPSNAIKLFAIHKHLMDRPERFVANPLNYISTRSFDVRPEVDVEIINEVDTMVRQHAPAVASFVNKAREIVQRSQQLAEQSWSEPPSTSAPNFETVFTQEEQLIARYLLLALHKRRNIQAWPFQNVTAFLAKRIYRSPNAFAAVDDDLLHRLVVDLGIVAPWHDLPSHERELMDHRIPQLSKLKANEAQRHVQKYAEQAANSQSTGSSSETSGVQSPHVAIKKNLGIADYYEADPLESVRHDFGNLPVYVIDDAGAEELDDGLSIEPVASEPGRYWIHVHIADPTAILHPGHALSLNARSQLETMYLVHETLPMIPTGLMEHLSLGRRSAQGLPERVMSFSVKVDPAQGVIDRKVRAGIVRNVQVLKYDQVDQTLGLPPPAHRYPFGGAPVISTDFPPVSPSAQTDLSALHDAAQTLIAQRLKLPLFYFSVPKANVSFVTDQSSVPRSVRRVDIPTTYRGFPDLKYQIVEFKDMDVGARSMVSEFMKAACHTASVFALEHGAQGIRRTASRMSAPSEEAFQDLLSLRGKRGDVDFVDALRLGATAPPAQNTLEPRGHWMLGIPDGEGYMRVTSPLRRFEDMANHWSLKAALLPDDRRLALHKGWMEGVVHDLTVRGPAMRAQDVAHTRFWTLTFLRRWREGRIRGEHAANVDVNNLQGIVIDKERLNVIEGGFVTRVYLPELGFSSSLKTDTSLSELPIGTPIRVKVAKVALGFSAAATLELV